MSNEFRSDVTIIINNKQIPTLKIAETVQFQPEELNTNHYSQTMMDFLKSVTDTQGINSAQARGVEGER